MIKIGIITGSTRDARVNIQVAGWVKSIAEKRTDAEFELVDIKDYKLPNLMNLSLPLCHKIIRQRKRRRGLRK